MNIIDNFNKAASTYDQAADIQKIVADNLLARIRHLSPTTILDIGCGTGLVTEKLALLWPHAQIFALDAAPGMLSHIKQKRPQVTGIEADAATFQTEQTFDLVVSSMLLHWLPRPDHVLRQWQNLVSPQGLLAIALPLAGSLQEWKDLCANVGLPDNSWRFPDLNALDSTAHIEVEHHCVAYQSVHAFLKTLHRTGAQTSHAHPTRPNANFYKLLRKKHENLKITYVIAYGFAKMIAFA